MIFICGREELGEAAFLTDDEVRPNFPTLVPAIKVALCLLIVFKLQNLPELLQEASLTSTVCAMDHDSIDF